MKKECAYCTKSKTFIYPCLTKPSDEPFTAENPFVCLDGHIEKNMLVQLLTCGHKSYLVQNQINYCPMCGRKLKVD